MRSYLKKGIWIKFYTGECYEIISEGPIGEGGGSIIYEALRVFPSNGTQGYTYGNIRYAVKECFPISQSHSFVRTDSFEIVPEGDTEDSAKYLEVSKKMQLREMEISSEIYKEGFRITPIVLSAEEAMISADHGEGFHKVKNAFTVMESLSNKGQSLKAILGEQKNLSLMDAVRVIRQILYSLEEVHRAGYLYLDLQEGNIFVKGSLSENNEFITLIDFGSARKMTEDGKTEPVRDRVLFSTEGFASPEMILENDGTLRLGPESDMYSVGYLFLLLLTGKKYGMKEVYHNTNGVYISGFRMKKLNCPKHLQGSVNRILANALAVDRNQRYASAEHMLVDINQLLEALSPLVSNIHAVKYDAFICYRHNEIDSPFAVSLRNELERYKIPKDILASAKRKKIEKVFVDEGELSSCADFGLQIKEALKNSEYLIVICSLATPHSQWVNLEIETFLEYHDRSHILAVLTEGEPEEAFPLLLKEGKHGSEVLAADARGKNLKDCIKKMKKDALLRIVAPMMGTTYDSLKQRKRAYVMKRNLMLSAIALVILTGFLSFSLWQNAKITEQYRENLKNQAKILSEEALEVYSQGDVKRALELALEISPDDYEQEEAIPEQIYALNTALSAHNVTKTQFYPCKTIDEESFKQGSMSPKQGVYACLNRNGDAFFLNPETGEVRWKVKASDITYCTSVVWEYVLAVSDTVAILYGKKDIVAVDIEKKTVINQLSGNEIHFNHHELDPVFYVGDEIKTAFTCSEYDVVIYNITTGVIEDAIAFEGYNDLSAMTFSVDGQRIYVGFDGERTEDKEGGLVAYEISEQNLMPVSNDAVVSLECSKQDGLLALQYVKKDADTKSYASAQWSKGVVKDYWLAVYQTDDLACVYKLEVGTFGYNNSGIFRTELLDDNGEVFDAAVYWTGSTLGMVDLDRMELYRTVVFQSPVLNVKKLRGSGGLIVGLKNGEGRLLNSHAAYMFPVFELDVPMDEMYVVLGESTLLLTRIQEKLVLFSTKIDTMSEMTEYPGEDGGEILYVSLGKENYRIVKKGISDYTKGITVYPVHSDSVLYEYQVEKEELYIRGIWIEEYKDVPCICYLLSSDDWNGGEYFFFRYHMETGEKLFEKELSSYSESLYLDCAQYDTNKHRLYALRNGGGMVYFDLETEPGASVDRAVLRNKKLQSLALTSDGNHCILLDEEKYYVFDTEKRNVTETILNCPSWDESTYYQSGYITGNASSKIAVFDGNQHIDIYDCKKHKMISQIDLLWADSDVCSYGFLDQDQKILVADATHMAIYDCETGEKMAELETEKVVGDPLMGRGIQLKISPESLYFSVYPAGVTVYSEDGALMPDYCYIYRYDGESRIHPVCKVDGGFFDPVSLEVGAINDTDLYYSGLYTYDQLEHLANDILN